MKDAHFHLNARPVYRSAGHSAVASAAYQTNTKLTHHSKNLARPGMADEKKNKLIIEDSERAALDSGMLTDAVREGLAGRGIECSDDVSVTASGTNNWTIHDNENGNKYHVQAAAPTLELKHRKALNKGKITDELRDDLGHVGVKLSDDATAAKQGRRHWTITDGDITYEIREYRTRITNPLTKKREVVERGLDVYRPRTYDYSRKKDVVGTWMRSSALSPGWLQELEAKGGAVTTDEREWFWNNQEGGELRRDGRVAHTMVLALSRELTLEQNIDLVNRFVDEQIIAHNRVADIAIHRKKATDGLENLHAHILYTDRELQQDGSFADTKNYRWGNEQHLHRWREAWGDTLNSGLEQAGTEARASHESYATRGLNKKPGVHLGDAATNIEARGVRSDKGNRNRKIAFGNQMRRGDVASGKQPVTTIIEMTAQALTEAARATYQALDAPPPSWAEKERKRQEEEEPHHER